MRSASREATTTSTSEQVWSGLLRLVYFPDSMPAVWNLVEQQIDEGHVIVPREVYREVLAQTDEISKILARHARAVVDPSRQVQARGWSVSEAVLREVRTPGPG